MIIELDDDQMEDAKSVARMIYGKYHQAGGPKTRYSHGEIADMRYTLNGICAELAVSIHLGEVWHRGDSRKPDVGRIHEVRWTSKWPPELRLYDPADRKSPDYQKAHRKFWLVTGNPPRLTIHGGTSGQDILARGERRVSREGMASWFLSLEDLEGHQHGWNRNEDGDWICARCLEWYVGQVPVDERHPDGMQHPT